MAHERSCVSIGLLFGLALSYDIVNLQSFTEDEEAWKSLILKCNIEMYICVVLKTTLLQILSFHYTSICFYYFGCFYKTIVFQFMTDKAFDPPAKMDLDS